ncbi:MAG: hypothetical protein HW421_3327 [Ignavibacteria bacterium]|nr:hypothetical protein [Ignavibacteria bacterium]
MKKQILFFGFLLAFAFNIIAAGLRFIGFSYLKNFPKEFFFLFIFLIALSGRLSADGLRVIDPNSQWRTGKARIDSAYLEVNPVGIYVEMNLYMEISAKNAGLNSNDVTEIEMLFSLPDNAHIVDSWLWVEDTIVKAMLLDKWSANLIYEGIVKRRRDPSVLYKNSQTAYEYRIYPVNGYKARRCRLSWLVPVKWYAQYTSVTLPNNIMQLSNSVPKLKIFIKNNPEWNNPNITGKPNIKFTDDSSNGMAGKSAVVQPNDMAGAVSLTFDSPMRNGLYFKTYATSGDNGYYQLALLPSSAFEITERRKVLILIDNNIENSKYSNDALRAHVATIMNNCISPKDSFNIIYADFSIHLMNNTWISGDQTTAEYQSTLQKISKANLGYQNQLSSLVLKGIDFIKESDGKGTIVILSNSDREGNTLIANPLYSEIQGRIGSNDINFLSVDYNGYPRTYNISGRVYTGNEYLYSNLTFINSGYYTRVNFNTENISDAVSRSLDAMKGSISAFDLMTTMNDGFCFGRYNMTTYNSNISRNDNLISVGRFVGKYPLTVQAAGIAGGKAFSTKIVLDSDGNIEKKTKQIWYTQYIRSLELLDKQNMTIESIIKESKANRILSLYTSFLALEPWMMPEQGTEEEEEIPNFVTDDNLFGRNCTISVYPNPFSTSTSIEIKLDGMSDFSNMKIAVYNLYGEKVKDLSGFEVGNTGTSLLRHLMVKRQ